MVIAENSNCTGYLHLVPVEKNIVFKGKLSTIYCSLHFFLDAHPIYAKIGKRSCWMV